MKQEMYDYLKIMDESSNWWYRGRRAILDVLAKKYLPQNQKLNILDIGCGMGSEFKWLEKYGTVFGVDPSKKAVEYSKGNIIKIIINTCSDKGTGNVTISGQPLVPTYIGKIMPNAREIIPNIERKYPVRTFFVVLCIGKNAGSRTLRHLSFEPAGPCGQRLAHNLVRDSAILPPHYQVMRCRRTSGNEEECF